MGFEFTLRMAERFGEFRRRWREHARIIADLAKEFFGENLAGVYVFGSTVRGDHGPLSDIDVAVVLRREADEFVRARFRSLVRERLGPVHPFEVHVITEGEWKGWYRRFVGEDFVRVG